MYFMVKNSRRDYMTKVIAGFPCIGKTTLYNEGLQRKFMDLEFRETATTRGMTEEQKEIVFENYACIVEQVIESGTYEFIFVMDDIRLLTKLSKKNISFTLVIPNPKDATFIEEHHQRVLKRNNQEWYDDRIIPRLNMLENTIRMIQEMPNATIKYLGKDKKFIIDVLY